MAVNVSVSVSGPAFSFLLYENARSTHNQEGFMLGQLIETQKKSITDNDVPTVQLEKTIIVNSIIPCPNLCYFYNASGIINGEKLVSFFGSEIDKVVGWYKFKHGFDLSWKLSVREKVVHKQLASSFNIPMDLFLICLLTTTSNILNSTHFYKQTFIRYQCPIFQQIKMHIVNLSDPNTSYKSPLPCSDTFKNILTSLKMDTKKMQGLEVITKTQTAIQSHIESVVENLSVNEKKMHNLEKEVLELRKRLQEKNALEKSNKIVEEKPFANGLPDERSESETFSTIQDSWELLKSSESQEEPEPYESSGEQQAFKGRGPSKNSTSVKSTVRNESPTKKPVESENGPRTRSTNKPTTMSYSQVTQKAKN